MSNFGMAYQAKKKYGAHMCHGGDCSHPSHMAQGGEEKPIKGHGHLGVEFDPTATPREGYPKSAKEQQERLEAEHHRMSEMQKRKPEKMADGGTPDPQSTPGQSSDDQQSIGKRIGYPGFAKGGEVSKRERALAAFHGHQSKEDPDVDGGDAHPMAEEHVSHPESHDSEVEHDEENQEGDEDEGAGGEDPIHPMIKKLIMSRLKGYSKGGVVANENSGESSDDTEKMAKWEDNEMDDLPKDDHLVAHQDGSEELGDEQEEYDRHDIVRRVLKSRSKKDRPSIPGEGSTYGKGR